MSWPNRTRPVPAHFKAPNVSVEKQLILHELLGSRVGQLLKLPVAETCPTKCQPTLLASSGAKICLANRPEASLVVGVASLDVNPHQIRQVIFPGPRVCDDLLHWRHCAEIAVFDELMCNGDRNLTNFARVAQHEFYVFDHDEILGGVGWTLGSLRQRLLRAVPVGKNLVADLIARSQNQVCEHKVMKVAANYAEQFRVPEAMSSILAAESGVEEDVISELIRMLNVRVKCLPDLVSTHIRHVQLQIRQMGEFAD
jgi:hypothetical protein